MTENAIAVTTDAGLLARLHVTGFDDAWSADFFSAMLNQPGITALGTPHGFILMRCVVDEAEVLTIAVDPAKRNTGLGFRLLEAGLVLAMAQRATRCFLEVAEDNAPAIAIYKKAGFTQTAERKDYYQRRDKKVRALLMEWHAELKP